MLRKREGQLVVPQPFLTSRFSPQRLTPESLLVNRTIEILLKTTFGVSGRRWNWGDRIATA